MKYGHSLRRALLVILIAGLGASALGSLTWLALRAADGATISLSDRSGNRRALPAPPGSAYLTPEVQRRLATAVDDASVRLIVVLRPSSETDLPQRALPSSEERSTLRAHYVQGLQANFYQAKAPLLPTLDQARRAGALTAERDLWIVNAVSLEVTASFARALAASPAVSEVHLDHYARYVESGADFQEAASTVAVDVEAPWGLDAVEAPRVWSTFAVSGTGAVVAVMDTGVDWQHPDLMGAYRGNVGKGIFDHAGAWYDAVSGGTYPYDDHGHGTHVVGTAVGAATGVAPGAHWIGVKVLNAEGFGYDSWILDGFQWLLAPNGEASMAPDVVNASWSSMDTNATVFLDAIRALKAADILAIFAAGNAGPQPRSVGSPASNPGVFAVGASDPDSEVPSFSGRGPSPWDEIKPLVVAPGVNVISTAPGGTYVAKSGTSMAAPHVAGLGALMRSISPTVSVDSMARMITETARPLTVTVPNNDSGWGEINAFQTMVALVKPALLVGSVTGPAPQDETMTSIAGATISAWPDRMVPGDEPGIEAVTNAQGQYTLALMPGRYVVRAEAFGYQSQTVSRVVVVDGPPYELDFSLSLLPAGRVQGDLTVQDSPLPPTSTVLVRALGTPAVVTSTHGTYDLLLPAGDYTLEVRGLGYRVETASISVVADTTLEQDFVLTPAPKLLLVDEGAWYYGSQTPIWTDSLDALRYVYDLARIKNVGSDLPVSSTLELYDIVLWSSPQGSPGLIGAGSVLSNYLASGGRLLLSGQDIAFLDAGGALLGAPRYYLVDQLGVQFVADNSGTPEVIGVGPFDGLHLNLRGGSGADNQRTPDVVASRDVDLASVPWTYAGGAGAGVAADICVPYRGLFFAFGLEGISEAADRNAVLQRSIDWLTEDPLVAGLTVKSITPPTLISLPGDQVRHVLEIRHIGYAGTKETVKLATSGASWSTELSDDQFELAPCTSTRVTVTRTIPVDAVVNVADTVTISVTSDRVSTPVAVALTTKTPASVLLVDDDRWYPVEDAYSDALDLAGVDYDIWDTRSGAGGTVGMTSPPTETLSHYPIVVWFTGYDWYAPVEDAEAARLRAYLDQGGKLLLSSQDFIYHHQDEALTKRLGVMLADWADQAEAAQGIPSHPAGQLWATQKLDYPFPNWSHTVEPEPVALPVARGQNGQPIGISVGSPGTIGSQTLFYSFPLEALPLPARALALANGIGWLSPLGGSEWRVSPRTPAVGEQVIFELAVRNTGNEAMQAQAVHRVPDAFEIDPLTLPPELVYDVTRRELVWQGTVPTEEPVELAWKATWLGGEAGGNPTVTLSLPAWGLAFVREAPFYGVGVDLGSSKWRRGDEPVVRTTEPLTLAYTIHNSSLNGPAEVVLSLWMMTGLGPMTATTPLTQGLSVAGWHGVIGPSASEVVSIPVTGAVWERPVRIDALLMTTNGSRWEDSLWLDFEPWRSYMPVIR